MLNRLKERINDYLFFLSFTLKRDSWQHLKPCDVLLVRHDHNCGYIFQDKAYAHLFDSFGDLCTKRGLSVGSIALPYSKMVGKRAYNSPVSANHSSSMIVIFGSIIRLIRGEIIGREWMKSRQVELWCQILEKAIPKYVIGMQPPEFLCRAGKIKKIPVYDLQHGVISDECNWYGEVYRNGIPIQDLPDGFLCWDDQSVTTLSKWACNKGIRVLKVGNPWFLRFTYVHPEDLLVNESIADGNIIDDNRPCIVVSLQWGLATEYPDRMCNGVMVDALEKVILDTIDSYNWIIRLHPHQLRAHGSEKEMVFKYLKTTFGAEKARIWLMSSEIPLPIVLSKADLHITYHSTTVVEAAWLGVRSGLLNEQLDSGGEFPTLFSYERSVGMVEVIPQNPEVIKQWIIDTLAKGHGESTLKDSGKNLDAFMDEIAGRKS